MINDKIRSKEIFGAEVQYFRLDPKYWEKIIIALKETGLRTVTTYVQWGTHLVGEPDEQNPAGCLDFEGRTDPKLNLMKFIQLIEKHGMNLNFRCGPFCCNEMVYGGYPPWLVMGDPNIMVWDYQNRTTQGYWIGKREGSQPSYLHPEYLDWCRKWIDEVDKIIIPHLKSNGGCITMLNLDNEVSYIVQDGFLSSDYNPINIAPGGYYHQFLEQKYTSIKNLNYGKKYGSFEEIEAPRKVPDVIGDDLSYYLDWCEFSEWTMAEYITVSYTHLTLPTTPYV
jgi:beta-galactosidase